VASRSSSWWRPSASYTVEGGVRRARTPTRSPHETAAECGNDVPGFRSAPSGLQITSPPHSPACRADWRRRGGGGRRGRRR
jgi:hypothetical protein